MSTQELVTNQLNLGTNQLSEKLSYTKKGEDLELAPGTVEGISTRKFGPIITASLNWVGIRRADRVNQDGSLVRFFSAVSGQDNTVVTSVVESIVVDGMGGHDYGEVAAQIALEAAKHANPDSDAYFQYRASNDLINLLRFVTRIAYDANNPGELSKQALNESLQRVLDESIEIEADEDSAVYVLIEQNKFMLRENDYVTSILIKGNQPLKELAGSILPGIIDYIFSEKAFIDKTSLSISIDEMATTAASASLKATTVNGKTEGYTLKRGWMGDAKVYAVTDTDVAELTDHSHVQCNTGALIYGIGTRFPSSTNFASEYQIEPGTSIVVCSDGLHRYFTEEFDTSKITPESLEKVEVIRAQIKAEIFSIVRGIKTEAEAQTALINLQQAIASRGAVDNMSVSILIAT